MMYASSEVFAGRFDPLMFRDCTANNLVGRLQMAATFRSRHERDLISASGLIETLADVRALYPDTCDVVDELVVELSAAQRYGDFFDGDVARAACQRLLDALGVAAEAPVAVATA